MRRSVSPDSKLKQSEDDPHGLLAFRTLANLLTEGKSVTVSGYSE